MKKVRISIMFLLLCILLVGCSKGSENTSQDVTSQTNEIVLEGNQTQDEANNEIEFVSPTIEWWDIYNPNGFDTFTALISNPNNIAIDVSYDLVFYKNNTEVSRLEYCLNESIAANNKDIIWANFDIPNSEEVDDVKLENVLVSETHYTPINGTFDLDKEENGEAYYNFKFVAAPEIATVHFLFYVDSNNNNKCDKGEIVLDDIQSLLVQEGQLITLSDPNAKCEIYFKAY